MNTVIHNKLEYFGFTSNEASVYLALVTYGNMKASAVIQETKLQRSAVYGVLDQLVERSYVSKVMVGGVAIFSADDSLQFIAEIEKKRASAVELAQLVKSQQVHAAREVHTLEGVSALQRATNDMLTIGGGDTIYFLGSSKAGDLADIERFWKKFHSKRENLRIASKILYDRTTDPEVLDKRNSLVASEAKYMPFGDSLPLAFTVRGDRTIITTIDEAEPLIFTIRSASLAKGVQEYFEYLWNQV